MKLSNICTVYEFCTSYLDRPLPARASFSIAKFLSDAESSITLFYKNREELVRKYANEINEDPNKPGSLDYKMDKENYEAFNKELTDLLNTEVDINFKLYYEDLESLPLTPRELTKILPYIETK